MQQLASETATPTIVELGTFWAYYYSMWDKHAIAGSRLVPIEPDADSPEVGRVDLGFNGIEASHIIDAAIGAEHDVSAPLIWESDGESHITRHVTIDGLIGDLGLGRIDLLLCDVQGAELGALRGAVRALANRRLRFLVVSTHHHRASGDPLTHQQCLQMLRNANAQIIAEHSVSESCSGDGLILASTDPRDRGLHADVTIVRARDSLFGELEWDLAEARAEIIRRRM